MPKNNLVKITVWFIVVIFILFLMGQCTGHLSKSEIIAPVYSGDLKVHGCRRIGPCEEFELSEDFRFFIWWGNDLDQLSLGIDDHHIPKNTIDIYAQNVKVTVHHNQDQTVYTSQNIKIYEKDMGHSSGLYTTFQNIKLPSNIVSDMKYNVEIVFKLKTKNNVRTYNFIGIFKQGKLTAFYPVV